MEDLPSPANASELAKQSPLDVTQEYYALGELYAYPGKMDQAIEQYLKGYEFAKAQAAAVVPQLAQELGIAYLHKAEMDNEVYQARRSLFDPPAFRRCLPQTRGVSEGNPVSSEIPGRGS
jgi:hypothetical protein